MSEEHFIDEDLNYDVVIVPSKFKNPKSKAMKDTFNEGMSRFFNTPEEMCYFMTEVAKNHPEGINFRYFIQLMTHYTTSKALSSLESKGLITSSVNDDGEILYQLTELGKKISKQI